MSASAILYTTFGIGLLTGMFLVLWWQARPWRKK